MKHLLFLFALLWAHAAAAQRFQTAQGEVLPAPEIGSLTCEEQDALLMRYSVSGYRAGAPLSEDHPDWPVFEYENQLAAIHYRDCQAGAAIFLDLAPTFGQGFRGN